MKKLEDTTKDDALLFGGVYSLIAAIGCFIYSWIYDDPATALHGALYIFFFYILQLPLRKDKEKKPEETEVGPAKLRHFVLVTAGYRSRGRTDSFIHYISQPSIPTLQECKDIGRIQIPDAGFISFISITELSRDDFKRFKGAEI